MTLDYDDLLNSIMGSLDRIKQVDVNDIPNIDLYMDQLLTFMDDSLHKSVRRPGADKILTKTMINNYAKNDLLPPPVKKKYSKDHIIILIFIYYYKSILSINDIHTLLKPMRDRFGNTDKTVDLKDIYRMIYDEQDDIIENLKKDIENKYKVAIDTFPDAPEDERAELQLLNFISMLSYDVFMKKLLIETMLDHVEKVCMNKSDEKNGKESRKKKK
ncbi:DUF1836 domain-containing protein [Butyrivibrio sp. WCD3002]|uniref:DUF1836 domain-containing protein n=1 Tax=Butyrivibrio sp. WCD3002 TaxID=1280676 RepID=UPI000412A904|nr:DUF1836 domain-containing protein [Butyrivibrio sp. WCD3002]